MSLPAGPTAVSSQIPKKDLLGEWVLEVTVGVCQAHRVEWMLAKILSQFFLAQRDRGKPAYIHSDWAGALEFRLGGKGWLFRSFPSNRLHQTLPKRQDRTVALPIKQVLT